MDPVGEPLIWAGAMLILLSALVVAVLLLQWVLSSSDLRLSRFKNHWLPVIFQAMYEELDETTLPYLPRAQQWNFLLLWVHAHMAIRGDAAQRLSRLGRDLNLRFVALKALRRRHPADRIMATLALGFLREQGSKDLLVARLASTRGQEQVYVCRALLEIDAKANAAAVLTALTQKSGFDSAAVGSLLKPFAMDLLMPVQRQLARLWQGKGDPQDAVPLLKLADALHLPLPPQVLMPALSASGTSPVDAELISAALRLYSGDSGSGLLEALAEHPEWPVRVQVARALGHLGSLDSLPVVLKLLNDRQWWVRYRAAQALLSLPGLRPQEAMHAAGQSGDRYAQSMLRAVMAEQAGGR